MRAWIYNENKYEELGAWRWLVTWYTPTADWSPDDPEGPDHDRMRARCVSFRGANAMNRAIDEAKRRIKGDFYGQPIVQEQAVEWYVKEDGVGAWENIGEPIYVEED